MIDFHIVRPVYHDPVKTDKQQTVRETEDNYWMDTTLAERLTIARTDAGLTQTQLAKHAGCGQSLIGNLESGNQKSSTKLPHIARVLGVNIAWLQDGHGARSNKGLEPVPLSGHTDLLPVPRVRFKLSAGVSGFAIEPENGTTKPIYFRKDWFELNNYRPDKLFSVRVSGASMEPSLWDGDLVVVNTDDTLPYDGDVFAINYEGELVIKRMRRDAGEWLACSDNADQRRFSPKRCTEDVRIIGRIIYKQSERI